MSGCNNEWVELGEIIHLTKAWVNGEASDSDTRQASPETCPRPGISQASPETCPRPGISQASPETCPRPGIRQADPDTKLAQLKTEALSCQRCQIAQRRTNLVFGQGSSSANLFIIGEGPGEQEDLTGVAFCGPSGEQLTKMLHAIKLSREQVFIGNIIKCRPPNNRNPLPEEIANCHEYLLAQLAIVKPRVILTLGAIAAQTLLNSNEGIGRLRGRIYQFNKIPLIVSYHPAYLLRDSSKKPAAWQDLKMVRKLLDETQDALS